MNKKAKLYFKTSLSAFILVGSIPLFSFIKKEKAAISDPPETCKYWTSFDRTEETWFEFTGGESGEELSISDILEAEKRTRVQHVEDCIAENGKLTTTTVLLNPDEVYEKWMQKIITSVVTGEGVKLYGSDGELVLDQPASEQSVQEQKAIESEFVEGFGKFPEFKPLTFEDLASFQEHGFLIQHLENGVVSMQSESMKMVYDYEGLTLELQEMQEGTMTSSTRQTFAKDERGNTYPEEYTQRTRGNLSSGTCGFYVTHIVYSDYSMGSYDNVEISGQESPGVTLRNIAPGNTDGNRLINIVRSKESESITVFPNPNPGLVNIQLPDSDPSYLISMLDANGKTVKQPEKSSGGTLKIDVTDIPAGVYFIKVESQAQTTVHRFIKQ